MICSLSMILGKERISINDMVDELEIIEKSIFAETPEQAEELERQALSLLHHSQSEALFILIFDTRLAADVRGIAARMFAECTDWNNHDFRDLAMAVASSNEPLVRLGFVLGLEDGDNQEMLARLCQDSHPRVREEANRLRASANFY